MGCARVEALHVHHRDPPVAEVAQHVGLRASDGVDDKARRLDADHTDQVAYQRSASRWKRRSASTHTRTPLAASPPPHAFPARTRHVGGPTGVVVSRASSPGAILAPAHPLRPVGGR